MQPTFALPTWQIFLILVLKWLVLWSALAFHQFYQLIFKKSQSPTVSPQRITPNANSPTHLNNILITSAPIDQEKHNHQNQTSTTHLNKLDSAIDNATDATNNATENNTHTSAPSTAYIDEQLTTSLNDVLKGQDKHSEDFFSTSTVISHLPDKNLIQNESNAQSSEERMDKIDSNQVCEPFLTYPV